MSMELHTDLLGEHLTICTLQGLAIDQTTGVISNAGDAVEFAARVLARGRRVFFSPAEVAREEDGVSSSDLGGRAMSRVSERMTAGTPASDAEAPAKFQAATRASTKRST